MACTSYIDYSFTGPCPIYNLENCSTPDILTTCEVLSNTPRFPCWRYSCDKDEVVPPAAPEAPEVPEVPEAGAPVTLVS